MNNCWPPVSNSAVRTSTGNVVPSRRRPIPSNIRGPTPSAVSAQNLAQSLRRQVGLEVGESQPKELLAGVAVHVAGALVHVEDVAVGVVQDERIGRVLDQETEPRLASPASASSAWRRSVMSRATPTMR